MNISIVFTSQAEKAQPYVALAQQLREQVATLDSSFVVASSPDIVHVFGGFDKATQALLAKYRDMRIPTVLTACDALAAYTAGKQTIDRSQLSRSRRKLLMLATAVHAVGNEEGAALAATAPKADVSVVANPVDDNRQHQNHDGKLHAALSGSNREARTNGQQRDSEDHNLCHTSLCEKQ